MVKHHSFMLIVVEIKFIVKYLVEHGADVNKKNRYGVTTLFGGCK